MTKRFATLGLLALFLFAGWITPASAAESARGNRSYSSARYNGGRRVVPRKVVAAAGGAAVGALVGGAARGPKGAVTGAVVGGMAGLLIDHLAHRHDNR